MSRIDLDQIRQTLIRLEDTIIYLLIERAQFAHNQPIYEISDKVIDLNLQDGDQTKVSFLDWILFQTESVHAKVRRYESPDEYPFTTPINKLPKPILPPLNQSNPYLYQNNININPKIKEFYINHIVNNLTHLKDDGQYGSSAVRDVEILQAVSRRIHYGKFVAECKFRESPKDFIDSIKSKDYHNLEKLITKPKIEEILINRLKIKSKLYGQEIDLNGNLINDKNKINTELVINMYKDWVIPLTRHVEVEYLLCRLDGLSNDEINELLNN
ncbi:hypothetical protein CROQUDRAFT_659861 [Cronartium quercuum f. sp. fusiforme G11]|uniref:Chorismate mutase n=1 Tax=Cronartium quercuum f. sp. fusiforme G11 TaxID=708437 RepID=A0A9P6ND61_9BASI|nr:hypothetical protein CROQUDRAFT_659861 [Cronartium quercuum f. sp. fusiforme G11]